MENDKSLLRYKREKDSIIIEVAVKNSRQLFNERDPAPFRERDLDPQFVNYLVSSVEEFSLRTKMKVRILTSDSGDLSPENSWIIGDAIRSFFMYESELTRSKQRKKNRSTRYFFLIGIVVLVICSGLAQWIESAHLAPTIIKIGSLGFVILGWVAMWHPMEGLLYDWWPVRQQIQYFDKIATMDIEFYVNDEK